MEGRTSEPSSSFQRSRMFISNIQTLPAELVLEIYGLSGNSLLILVCTRFCDIIYSSPSSWRTIHVGKAQVTADALVFLLKRLERGGSGPLDISIQSAEPIFKVEIEMWRILTQHRYRIRKLYIQTDKMTLCAKIMHKILIAKGGTVFPSLRNLSIQHDLDFSKPHYSSTSCQRLLTPVPSLLPALTTLCLPFIKFYIPRLSDPLLSLEILVLTGPDRLYVTKPDFYQIARLLIYCPRLTTLWLKDDRTGTDFRSFRHAVAPNYPDVGLLIRLPVKLPLLTRIALTVPGWGEEVLNGIDAPHLQDLHLDGTRSSDLMWNPSYFSGHIRETMALLSQRSPSLRRLALLGVYLPTETWKHLFGSGFPLPLFVGLESIAVRGVDPSAGHLVNMDDALLYEYAHTGTIALRRFAYTGMERLLSGDAICKLVIASSARLGADEPFELEVDCQAWSEMRAWIESLKEAVAVKTTLRPGWALWRGWWTYWEDLDPTEADSY